MSGRDDVAELTCDEVREMAGAFVLGALEPADEAAVRAHLSTCDDAHAEIAELGGVLPALGRERAAGRAAGRSQGTDHGRRGCRSRGAHRPACGRGHGCPTGRRR